jgi:hypothetical protein
MKIMTTVATHLVEAVVDAGVKRSYGVVAKAMAKQIAMRPIIANAARIRNSS